MKFSILMIWLVACLVSSAQAAEEVRVMSFNVRYGKAKDGDNHWEKRKHVVVKAIQQFNPDLMGTQETLKFQADYIQAGIKDYSYFGRSRMKNPNEHCGIFYKTDRFTQLAGGHFWLSESPAIPESKSWDSSLPRMATWVLLSDHQDESARPVLFVNTHFDHRGSQARLESARLIRAKIDRLQTIAENPFIIVTGDFNTDEGSAPYQAFLDGNEKLVDSFRTQHPREVDNEGTFNGFRGISDGARIDWILISPSLKLEAAEIDRSEFDGRYPSDHFPIWAVLQKPATVKPAKAISEAAKTPAF